MSLMRCKSRSCRELSVFNTEDWVNSYADSLESGMEAELENGRVARLLIKLGFINERPE